MAQSREFVDEGREVSTNYHRLDAHARKLGPEVMKKNLRGLINRDPDFLNPYLVLAQILYSEREFEEAEKSLNEAYRRALNLITDDSGGWPDVMRWKQPENRHIMRTILTRAIWSWEDGESEFALDLLRKLLAADPGDELGVRYYILAIRLGMDQKEFEERFDRGGYYTRELVEWFEENYEQFPDEFECLEE